MARVWVVHHVVDHDEVAVPDSHTRNAARHTHIGIIVRLRGVEVQVQLSRNIRVNVWAHPEKRLLSNTVPALDLHIFLRHTVTEGDSYLLAVRTQVVEDFSEVN